MEHVGSAQKSPQRIAARFLPFPLHYRNLYYHGELFVDSATGAILRLITKADLKPTDFVLQEDIRVDYSPTHSADQPDKQYIVPSHITTSPPSLPMAILTSFSPTVALLLRRHLHPVPITSAPTSKKLNKLPVREFESWFSRRTRVYRSLSRDFTFSGPFWESWLHIPPDW